MKQLSVELLLTAEFYKGILQLLWNSEDNIYLCDAELKEANGSVVDSSHALGQKITRETAIIMFFAEIAKHLLDDPDVSFKCFMDGMDLEFVPGSHDFNRGRMLLTLCSNKSTWELGEKWQANQWVGGIGNQGIVINGDKEKSVVQFLGAIAAQLGISKSEANRDFPGISRP